MTSVARLAAPIALASASYINPIAGAAGKHLGKRMAAGESSSSSQDFWCQNGRFNAKVLPNLHNITQKALEKLNNTPLFIQVKDLYASRGYMDDKANYIMGMQKGGYPPTTLEIAGCPRNTTQLRDTLDDIRVNVPSKSEGRCIAQVSLMKGKVCKCSGYTAKRPLQCAPASDAPNCNPVVCYGPILGQRNDNETAACAKEAGSKANCYGPIINLGFVNQTFTRTAACANGDETDANCYNHIIGATYAYCANGDGAKANCYDRIESRADQYAKDWKVGCAEGESCAKCYKPLLSGGDCPFGDCPEVSCGSQNSSDCSYSHGMPHSDGQTADNRQYNRFFCCGAGYNYSNSTQQCSSTQQGSYDGNCCSVPSTIVLVDFTCNTTPLEFYKNMPKKTYYKYYKPICTGTVKGSGATERCETGETGAVLLPEVPEGLSPESLSPKDGLIANYTILSRDCRQSPTTESPVETESPTESPTEFPVETGFPVETEEAPTEEPSGCSLAGAVVLTMFVSILGTLGVTGAAAVLVKCLRSKAAQKVEAGETSTCKDAGSGMDEGKTATRNDAGSSVDAEGPIDPTYLYNEVRGMLNTAAGNPIYNEMREAVNIAAGPARAGLGHRGTTL